MSDLDTPMSVEEVERSGIKAVSIADEFGLDIPVDSVPLPSKGAIYRKDSGLSGKEFLDITPMTARQEDILMSKALIKNGTVINKLIQSCLVDKSVRVEDLVAGDKTALMIALRITGYGANYPIETKCQECDEKIETEIDLSSLAVKSLGVQPDEPFTNKFTIQLPVSKKTITIKIPDGHDELEALAVERNKKRAKISTNSTITDMISSAIIEVEGVKNKNKIKGFVRNLPVKDSLAIRNFISKNEPGVEMKQHVVCESCGEESEVDVPMTSRFFWPDR